MCVVSAHGRESMAARKAAQRHDPGSESSPRTRASKQIQRRARAAMAAHAPRSTQTNAPDECFAMRPGSTARERRRASAPVRTRQLACIFCVCLTCQRSYQVARPIVPSSCRPARAKTPVSRPKTVAQAGKACSDFCGMCTRPNSVRFCITVIVEQPHLRRVPAVRLPRPCAPLARPACHAAYVYGKTRTRDANRSPSSSVALCPFPCMSSFSCTG